MPLKVGLPCEQRIARREGLVNALASEYAETSQYLNQTHAQYAETANNADTAENLLSEAKLTRFASTQSFSDCLGHHFYGNRQRLASAVKWEERSGWKIA
jgi:hypothetical protein